MSTPRRTFLARTLLACCAAGAFAGPALASGDYVEWYDALGDALIRRTDFGNDGPIHPAGVMPDLLEVKIGGWIAYQPASDPFEGDFTEDWQTPHLVRVELTFAGLVNPPGTLGQNGHDYDPYLYGPSPVYGFLEIDVDDDKNTGGELGAAATHRYLANVGRFGRVPYGSLASRAARSADDYALPFASDPQFRRTGADFTLTLCGCTAVTRQVAEGDADTTFEAGETWILTGPFFERAGGYAEACGSFGGSSNTLGMYDPVVKIEWEHDIQDNETDIALVYALTNEGSRRLRGEATAQPYDFNVANQNSIAEALRDVIQGAAAGGLPADAWELVRQWDGRNADDYLDPLDWEVRALFGTAYSSEQDGLYVWTDVGCDEESGDMDGDGLAGPTDAAAIDGAIASMDGTGDDADGVVNGVVAIQDFGPNFSLYDVNSDGLIDNADSGTTCDADFNGDGQLTVADFAAFRAAYLGGDMRCDFSGNGALDVADFAVFRSEYLTGC